MIQVLGKWPGGQQLNTSTCSEKQVGRRVERRHAVLSQLWYFEKGHRELRERLFQCEMVSSIALSFLSSNLTEEGASRTGIKAAPDSEW
jgi:hypothetical protein